GVVVVGGVGAAVTVAVGGTAPPATTATAPTATGAALGTGLGVAVLAGVVACVSVLLGALGALAVLLLGGRGGGLSCSLDSGLVGGGCGSRPVGRLGELVVLVGRDDLRLGHLGDPLAGALGGGLLDRLGSLEEGQRVGIAGLAGLGDLGTLSDGGALVGRGRRGGSLLRRPRGGLLRGGLLGRSLAGGLLGRDRDLVLRSVTDRGGLGCGGVAARLLALVGVGRGG